MNACCSYSFNKHENTFGVIFQFKPLASQSEFELRLGVLTPVPTQTICSGADWKTAPYGRTRTRMAVQYPYGHITTACCFSHGSATSAGQRSSRDRYVRLPLLRGWMDGVEFNAPLDTVQVISEAVFTANHLTDTDTHTHTHTHTRLMTLFPGLPG